RPRGPGAATASEARPRPPAPPRSRPDTPPGPRGGSDNRSRTTDNEQPASVPGTASGSDPDSAVGVSSGGFPGGQWVPSRRGPAARRRGARAPARGRRRVGAGGGGGVGTGPPPPPPPRGGGGKFRPPSTLVIHPAPAERIEAPAGRHASHRRARYLIIWTVG